MSFYSDLADEAAALLLEFGQSVTLRQLANSSYSGGSVTQTPTDYIGLGAVFNFAQRDIDGTLIKTGDQQLLMSVFQTNGSAMPLPTTADQIIIGSTTYTIQPSRKVDPAGTVVLYDLHIRGL
jgi:hypothetical protein